ncbi:MAG: DUF4286 family protein [Bacteroidia bacterium]|nr:DUF4286 family protein [Bacteroidia bacterium]
MIIYSVTVSVLPEISEEWLQWMKEVHIPEVLSTGHFLSYRMMRLLSPESEDGSETFNIQYECESVLSLEHYLNEHAPKLQAKHQMRYENQFVAFRTVLQLV